jgi:predicted small lipoprotein YifL
MIVKSLQLLTVAALLFSAGAGCGWAKPISWDLPPRDEPRDIWPDADHYDRQREDAADALKEIREERARKEAEYRARNPGVVPPGTRR